MSITANIKRNWAHMDSKKKRTTAILLIAILAGGFVLLTGNKPLLSKPDTSNKTTTLVTPQTRSLTNQDMMDMLQGQNRALADMRADMKQQLDQMRLTSPAAGASDSLSDEKVRNLVAEEIARANANKLPPPPSEQGQTGSVSSLPAVPLDGGATHDGVLPATADDTGPRFKSLTDNLPGATAPSSTASMPAGTRITAVGRNSKNSKVGEAGSYLPPGTILPYVMLSGMNAPTNQSGTKDPMPALLRIRGAAILPNGYEADLTDCMVTVSGYGQMADERAMLRTEKISCVRTNGMAIEADMKGYVTGEDGKPGVRGRLVSKTGEVIAQLLKTGAISTLGNVVATAAPLYASRSNSDGGNNVTINTGNSQSPAAVAAQQAGTGFNNVMDKIANIYAEYAKETFPVIEISPGREGNIQLVSGLELPQ